MLKYDLIKVRSEKLFNFLLAGFKRVDRIKSPLVKYLYIGKTTRKFKQKSSFLKQPWN